MSKHVSLNVSLFAPEQNISWGNILCFRETKTVSDFFRKILFLQQMSSRFPAEETTLTGFCGRVGCASKIEHARSAVFSEKVVGLPGKETMFPARLSAQETFWETMFPHATMFPRLRGPLKCI